jgi:hypothetical protein
LGGGEHAPGWFVETGFSVINSFPEMTGRFAIGFDVL